MIPYSILNGTIQSLDIRVLELAPDYFTFRVPLTYEWIFKEKPEITLRFFLYEKKCYEKVILTSYECSVKEKTSFWIEILVSIGVCETKERYQMLSKMLTKEYMQYMENKLTLSDVEIASFMTRYPKDQEEIYEEAKITKKIDTSYFEKVSILLDEPRKLARYLETPISAYEEKNIRGIHIGNSFCPHLLPSIKQVSEVLEKAKDEKLQVFFVFPPVSQSFYERDVSYLKELEKCAEEKEIAVEIEVNDLGMQTLLSERSWHFLRVSAGILLHKHIKDVRKKYLEGGKNIDYSDHGVYVPYYQMNTGTFCPVYSKKYKKSRGESIRVTHCDKICLQENFVYPKHLCIKGKFNSLFGVYEGCEKAILAMGKEWVVINQ